MQFVSKLIATPVLLGGLILAFDAGAHEMTPTYPKFESSFVSGISKTKMRLFNKRNDVSYYQINVFDSEWVAVSFVTPYKIIKMGYLETIEFDVYIKQGDLKKATYICSKSKLKSIDVKSSGISSRICSKIK